MIGRDYFGSDLYWCWFLAVVKGGMRRNKHFPKEVKFSESVPCCICSELETEIVVYEKSGWNMNDCYLHLDCFEEYVTEISNKRRVSIDEVVTVEQYPARDIEFDGLPEPVFDAYLEYLSIDEVLDDSGDSF